MLATLLTLGLIAQGPMARGDGPVPAFEVRGEAELSPAAALASAQAAAAAHAQATWAVRAERIAAEHGAPWMPDFLVRDSLRRSLLQVDATGCFEVVDRSDRARDHDFGPSYQTTLWIVEDPRRAQAAERRVRAALRQLERSTVAKLAGTAVFWGFVAFACAWLDRLSRGYMTWRLRLLGLLVGCAVPAALFLV